MISNNTEITKEIIEVNFVESNYLDSLDNILYNNNNVSVFSINIRSFKANINGLLVLLNTVIS